MPIVYPDSEAEPSTLESEIERQREIERKKQEEENKIAGSDERSKIEDIDLRSNFEDEKNRQKDLLDKQQPDQRPDQGTDLDEEEEDGEDIGEEVNKHVVPPLQEYLTTTTTIRPTKRRPVNKQDPICKLPVEPEYDVGYEAGYRFGTVVDSRIEFAEIPVKIKKSYDISLEFKTDQPDGVLFYAADSHNRDFIVLYLQDGFVSNFFNSSLNV